MKHKLLTLVLVVACAGGLRAQNDSTFKVDCGDNILICPGDLYAVIFSDATDTLFIGKNVKIMGGVPPYTYEWSCKTQGDGSWKVIASTILSDTTILNPYFMRIPYDYKCTFKLKVTDAENNYVIDSLLVLREEFIYLAENSSNLAEKTGDSQIYLTGERKDMMCVFPPMNYFAVIESDTMALPAYINIRETDSVTVFGVDSIGCHDYPRKELGKRLLVSIDESIACNNTMKLIANTLYFNNASEKYIRIYSTNGQLIYSKITTDTAFSIPSLITTKHAVCCVIVNNKQYSIHLIKP